MLDVNKFIAHDDDMMAELARLRAENETLKAKAKAELGPGQILLPNGRVIRLKVSEKGALSIYGLGRFPLTAYKGQWQVILSITKEIETFLADHSEELSTKD